MQATLALMREKKFTLEEIHAATGLPFYWLRKFAGREISNPGVNRVQRLYEFLSGRELVV